MRTTIQKWGNSLGIRLPKLLLDNANLTVNDTVEVVAENNSIIIRKADNKSKHKSIQERFAGFDGIYIGEEWDTGVPVGKEVW